MAFGCQGKVGRFVLKPPREISFSPFPGALGTARPTTHDLPYAIGKVGRLVLKPSQENFVFYFYIALGTTRPPAI